MTLADTMRANVKAANLAGILKINENDRITLIKDKIIQKEMSQKATKDLPLHLKNIEIQSHQGMTSYNIMIAGWDTSGPYTQEYPLWAKYFSEFLAKLLVEKGFQTKETFDHNEPYGSDPYYDYPHTTLFLKVIW